MKEWPPVTPQIKTHPSFYQFTADTFSREQGCRCSLFNPLPDDNILDLSKMKQSADDNFKFDENSRMFSKRVVKTVGKGEIARYEQFLLFPQCFSKGLFPRGNQRCHCVGMG